MNRQHLTTHSANAILQYLEDNNIISVSDVQVDMTKKEKEQLLEQHPYRIYQEKNGRWRTYIYDDTRTNNRKPIAKKELEELKVFLVSHYSEQNKNERVKASTLKELYPAWLEYKRLHSNRDTSISRINRNWNKFYANSPIINTPIQDLDELTLDEWAHALIKDNQLDKKQYHGIAIIMRQSLDFARKSGIISFNPFNLVQVNGKMMFRPTKKPSSETQIFFLHELESLCELAWNSFINHQRFKHKLASLAILFQFQTGLRIGELVALRYDDVESNSEIHVQRMYCYEDKSILDHLKGNSKDRQVFLTPMAKKILELAKQFQTKLGIENNGYIFSVNDSPLPPPAVTRLYKVYCEEIGTVHKSSHKARKTFISMLLDGKLNINTVREIAGHVDESTTLYCYGLVISKKLHPL